MAGRGQWNANYQVADYNRITKQIDIQQDDVGRLIGLKGANVRQLEAESNANVNIDGDKCLVVVSGSKEAVELAENAIYEQLGGRGVVSIPDVDEMSVRFLTRDNWLATLQKELSVEVIVGRRCARIKPLGDDLSVAKKAQDLIKERIRDASQLSDVTIRCPADNIKRITGDPALMQLKSAHGLEITLKKDDNGTMLILSGLKGIVTEAQGQIQAIIGGGKARDLIPLTHELLQDITDAKSNDLFRDIDDHVVKQFDVKVNLSVGATNAIITGDDILQVTLAKEKLQQIIIYYFEANCCIINAEPQAACQWVCGPDDRYVLRAQSTDLAISVDKENSLIWCCGKVKQLENYCRRVRTELDKWHSSHAEVYLDDKRIIGRIVGTRGENIRKLQADTQCAIAVDDMVVKIESDDNYMLRRGVAAINGIIQRFNEENASHYNGGRRDGHVHNQQPPTCNYADVIGRDDWGGAGRAGAGRAGAGRAGAGRAGAGRAGAGQTGGRRW